MDKNRFCCVCCGNMMEREEAQIVFRTGFFRNVHPLGCCKKCHADAAIADSRKPEEPWSDESQASFVHPERAAGNEGHDGPLDKPGSVKPIAVSI